MAGQVTAPAVGASSRSAHHCDVIPGKNGTVRIVHRDNGCRTFTKSTGHVAAVNEGVIGGCHETT
jgi:hypothetical protein